MLFVLHNMRQIHFYQRRHTKKLSYATIFIILFIAIVFYKKICIMLYLRLKKDPKLSLYGCIMVGVAGIEPATNRL